MPENRPSAESAASFIHRLVALGDRIAGLGYAVTRLECHWITFGSWILEIQDGSVLDRQAALPYTPGLRGPDAIQFAFDGRDRYLDIRISPTEHCTALNQWKTVEGIVVGENDPAEVVWDYVTNKMRRGT